MHATNTPPFSHQSSQPRLAFVVASGNHSRNRLADQLGEEGFEVFCLTNTCELRGLLTGEQALTTAPDCVVLEGNVAELLHEVEELRRLRVDEVRLVSRSYPQFD